MMAANSPIPSEGRSQEATRAESLIARISEKLSATANARNVYGEPIESHNRTVVPVARVGYGVGAGAGGREGEGSGGGGGGGVGAKPVGYIEITDQRTRFVSFSASRKIAGAAILGFAAGFLFHHAGARRGLFRR